MQVVQKAKGVIQNVKLYWKTPPKGRYMTFKEILSYAVGGIGFYFIVCMSYSCLLGATNVFISGTIGIGMTDMYVLYVIGVLSGIPLTGIRANIIDNTRNKAGKYRPYILRMGIPTVLLFVGMVWFPYNALENIFSSGTLFGKPTAYVIKCAVVLIFNILLQFFYYFLYDAYENLIHVLSPNSQERADVASIKSVVYSFGPSLFNIVMPLIAQHIFHTNQTDIRVYRLAFPIFGIIGILMCIIIYSNTQEKIIQAKTHIVQIKFTDALRAVAKNKYFWIISLAGWLGFLETAYSNILFWLYNYGGACTGTQNSIIVTIYGNASLWGMIAAPFAIRKWGKKNVQIVTNLFNILFILLMYPMFNAGVDGTGNIKSFVIWGVLACLYANGIVGAFAHILNPSIQADIRDYQQYKTGERIDGMFAAVLAIGNVITLITAGVLPAIQEKFGMTAENAKKVVSDPTLMSRILPGTEQTIGQLIHNQYLEGQDMFNPSNALYDVNGTLIPLLKILILLAAVGAFMNVVPYFFYDFTENRQKGVVRVLKIRALFEDYGNNALKDKELIEAIDLVRNAREMSVAEPRNTDKSFYKSIKDKEKKKEAKKLYREALEFNEEIEISKFVCEELDKFSSEAVMQQVAEFTKIYNQGLDSIKSIDPVAVKEELAAAKALPANTPQEKSLRKMKIEIAEKKLSSYKSYIKYYGNEIDFVKPDVTVLEQYFAEEDEINEQLRALNAEMLEAKREKNAERSAALKKKIKLLDEKRVDIHKKSKAEMDNTARFNRAAEIYIAAEKLIEQKENFSHFDEIAAQYDEAKIRYEQQMKADEEEAARQKAAEEAAKEMLLKEKAETKAAKKESKKNK